MVSLFNNLVRPWFKGRLARFKEQTQFNMLRVLSSELLANALLITMTSITNTETFSTNKLSQKKAACVFNLINS